MSRTMKIWSVFLIAAVVVKAKSENKCLQSGAECRFSSTPCCGKEYLEVFGTWIGEDYTCSVFDSGRCELTSSINNLQEHSRLVERLTDDNFEQLRIQYFKDVAKLRRESRENLSASEPKCISAGAKCRFSGKPCCGKEYLEAFGTWIGENYTCSVFDSGRCELTSSFKNLQKHLELVEKLDSTNFEELRRQYFTNLQEVEKVAGLTDRRQCISSGAPCRFSSKPCCGQEYLPNLKEWIGEDHTCAVFDSGLCKPNSSFKNLGKHSELVKKLNDNNFDELRIQYFKDLQRVEKGQTQSVPSYVPIAAQEPTLAFTPAVTPAPTPTPTPTVTPEAAVESVPVSTEVSRPVYVPTSAQVNGAAYVPASAQENRAAYYVPASASASAQINRPAYVPVATPEAGPSCISPGGECRFSNQPCCTKEPAGNRRMAESYVCSTFDTGRCEPISSIKNLTKLAWLRRNLNSTNFDLLRKQYFLDLRRIERNEAQRKSRRQHGRRNQRPVATETPTPAPLDHLPTSSQQAPYRFHT